MLKIENLSYKDGKKLILNNFSLQVGKGETVAVLGLNGSGKTTLVKSIFNIKESKKITGSVFVNGKDIKELTFMQRGKLLSLMPQTLPIPSVTLEELVMFGREPYMGFTSIPTKADKEKVRDCIKKMKLEHLQGRKVDTLSGGERQRAFFAMLLAQESDNIILDEPTSSLDRQGAKTVIEFLNLAKSMGKTVLVILHDLNEAMSVSDRVAVIDNGEKIFDGDWSHFIESEIPENIFLQAPTFIQSDGEEHLFFRPI